MIRAVLISVGLLGLVVYFMYRWQAMVMDGQPPALTRLDIYQDRITYRNGIYSGPSTLAIALKANRNPPRLIEVHSCDALVKLSAVVDVVRAEGALDFEILLPEDC
jgi:hypothetical protein